MSGARPLRAAPDGEDAPDDVRDREVQADHEQRDGEGDLGDHGQGSPASAVIWDIWVRMLFHRSGPRPVVMCCCACCQSGMARARAARPASVIWTSLTRRSAPGVLGHEPVPLERGEVPGEGGAVHAEGAGEPGEGDGAGLGEGDEQGHLGGAEAARRQGVVIELGDGPGRAPQVEAGAVGGDLGEGRGIGVLGHIGVYTRYWGNAQGPAGWPPGHVLVPQPHPLAPSPRGGEGRRRGVSAKSVISNGAQRARDLGGIRDEVRRIHPIKVDSYAGYDR